MFMTKQIQARFLEPNLLQQLGSSFWIGLEHVGDQRGQTLNLTAVTATIYNSAGTGIVSGLTLALGSDATRPVLQHAGYLLQTGAGKTLPTADTYRVVYSLVDQTGEVGIVQQTFVVRPNPF
jgi:hypothetical protein